MSRSLSAEDAAQRAGVSVRVIRRELREGRLRGRKIGKAWVCQDDDVERYLREADCRRAAGVIHK